MEIVKYKNAGSPALIKYSIIDYFLKEYIIYYRL